MSIRTTRPTALLLLLALLCVMTAALNPHITPPKHDPVAAMRGLIRRRLGAAHENQVSLLSSPPSSSSLCYAL